MERALGDELLKLTRIGSFLEPEKNGVIFLASFFTRAQNEERLGKVRIAIVNDTFNFLLAFQVRGNPVLNQRGVFCGQDMRN